VANLKGVGGNLKNNRCYFKNRNKHEAGDKELELAVEAKGLSACI
jgi:hypothetical protein